MEATREAKATHAPCNFRLESVPLPRLSLLPLLSKVTATSPACSHEKTPPITHIIRRSETVGKKTQQPSRSGASSTEKTGPRCGQHTCQISTRSSLGLGLMVVSHNFLPSVYSSHATYTRHFRSNFAACGLGFWGLSFRATSNACARVLVSVSVTYSQCVATRGSSPRAAYLPTETVARGLL